MTNSVALIWCISVVMRFQAVTTNSDPCFILLKKMSINILSFFTFSARWKALNPLKFGRKQSLSFLCSFTSRPTRNTKPVSLPPQKINTFVLDHIKRVGFPECSLSATCVFIREQQCGPLLKVKTDDYGANEDCDILLTKTSLKRINSLVACSQNWYFLQLTHNTHTTWIFSKPIYHSCGWVWRRRDPEA